MPCSPNPTCPNIEDKVDANIGIGSGLNNDHFAHMGYTGFVVLDFTEGGLTGTRQGIRVTGADLNLSQEITTPDVIDGSVDKTVYQMGPKIVEGTLNLPVIADTDPVTAAAATTSGICSPSTSVAGTLMNNLWDWVTQRDRFGRMCNAADVDIRYANHAAFTFDRCFVNTLTMNVVQQDMVTFDLNVIGRSRTPQAGTGRFVDTSSVQAGEFLSPARVLTWNDITVNGMGGCENNEILFRSNQVREFNLEINNSVDRFYSLNGTLFPVDINAGKREITGSLTLLGYNHILRDVAETNQNRFTEKNEIRIAAYVGVDTQVGNDPRDWTDAIGTSTVPASAIFTKKLASTVFQIEEVTMTNDVLETTVNWLALASDKDDANYEAIIPAPSCGFPAWGRSTT